MMYVVVISLRIRCISTFIFYRKTRLLCFSSLVVYDVRSLIRLVATGLTRSWHSESRPMFHSDSEPPLRWIAQRTQTRFSLYCVVFYLIKSRPRTRAFLRPCFRQTVTSKRRLKSYRNST